MAESRLKEPFVGFDSINERTKRVPNDLNDSSIRAEYLSNHLKWFLSNHEDAIPDFLSEVRKKYPSAVMDLDGSAQ